VQLADKVAVFDKGSLIEYGTHKELYGNGGTYTEMYRKQAEFFVDNT
jgi:ABC-type multidrug transport system fused ATPase/permease subunit